MVTMVMKFADDYEEVVAFICDNLLVRLRLSCLQGSLYFLTFAVSTPTMSPLPYGYPV